MCWKELQDLKRNELLNNKNDTSKVKKLCEKIFFETYGCLDNKIGSYYDYAEALCRCLNYTGLFKTSGRSIATKLRVAEYSKIKFDLLLHKYDFKKQRPSNFYREPFIFYLFYKSNSKYGLWYSESVIIW